MQMSFEICKVEDERINDEKVIFVTSRPKSKEKISLKEKREILMNENENLVKQLEKTP